MILVILISLCVHEDKGKGGGVGVREMPKCQITLADMGPENSGDSLCVCVCVSLCEHRKGGGGAWFSAHLWDQGGWR